MPHVLTSDILFLYISGSCVERAMRSVELIGPAVANGGFTTFLALVLLGASTSHTFLTFFKECIFFILNVFTVYLQVFVLLELKQSYDSWM